MDLFSRFRLLATAAIAVPLLILFALLWSMTGSYRSVDQALGPVRQSRSFGDELERVAGLAVEAESGQRGYLLTGQVEQLTSHDQAMSQLPPLFARVRKLSQSMPDTMPRIEVLRELVDQHMTLLARSIELQRLHQHAEAVALVDTARGPEVMATIRRMIGNLRQAEQGHLALARLDLEERLTRDSIAATVLAAFDILFLLGMVALLQRLFRLQQIATVCAWSKTIRDGDEWITFEEYLRRKFGMAITHGISREMAARLIVQGREEHIEMHCAAESTARR